MHHNRKSNHRKMIKPKFYSSSSDDDADDAAPLKWKPIIATFPMESNSTSKQNQSNPIIDSLNSQTLKNQKLSAEVIQKEEIYNQAEMEANKRMFGSVNPGRCLSKDEIRRRKDIILHIVNERLKSKLSELMGEFGERLEMNDTYGVDKFTEDDTAKYRNRSPVHDDDDDDSIPEAPPPPTFNTSSESSDDELDISMTKEFELYEKEIKEKISDGNSSNIKSQPLGNVTISSINESTATPSLFTLSSSYNSIQISPSNPIPHSQNTTSTSSTLGAAQMDQHWNILQQTSMNYQQNWQQSQLQQWSMTGQQAAQSVDMTPWIPPGQSQNMELFPPPTESEQMSLVTPSQHIPSFVHTNPPPPAGWIPPAFPSNFASVPQYSNPEWVTRPQSTQYMGRASIPPPQIHSLRSQAPERMKWNARGGYRSSGPYGRETTSDASVIPPNNFVNSQPNRIPKPLIPPTVVNIPIVSKSTFVNAILAAEQKSTTSNEFTDTRANQVNTSIGENRQKKLENVSNSQKRPYEQQVGRFSNDVVGKSTGNEKSANNSGNVGKLVRPNVSNVKRSRFDDPKNIQNTPQTSTAAKVEPIVTNGRSNSRNDHRASMERKERTERSKNRPRSPRFEARHEKTNVETFKFLTKFWNTNNKHSESTDDVRNSRNDRKNQPVDFESDNKNSRNDPMMKPVEWKNLCNVVDKLLDLTPNMLKDLPATDRRIKERNEILEVLSEDPAKFYEYVDKYGEVNVNWVVKMAQNILFPQGRNDNRVASAMEPFRNALNTPKEWLKLCKIVDKLLQIPSHIVDSLPTSDSRIKERNEIIMILSNDPEDLLHHDEKYGAHNVDCAILAAKRIFAPNGVCDERVRKIMLRQRDKLMGIGKEASVARSVSNDSESQKRLRAKSATMNNNDQQRSRSIPKEWNELCDIVDKVLSIPYEVRIKLSKKDPRWEQRDNILIVLSSDDPDKLSSESQTYGQVKVEWAIKSAKKIIFPNGSKDKTIVNKLSPQRNLLLRDRPTNKDDKMIKKVESTVNHTKPVKVDAENRSIKKGESTANKQVKVNAENKSTKDSFVSRSSQLAKNDQSAKEEKPAREKIVIQKTESNIENKTLQVDQIVKQPIKQLRSDKADHQPLTKPDAATNVSTIPVIIDESQVWSKLCCIVDQLLDIPPNAADTLPPSDKRLIEKNEILLILSQDPDNFSKFDANYGATNVSWAIKSARKLIYLDGRPNEKLIDGLWKKRDAILSSDEYFTQESKTASNNKSDEWLHIRHIATKVFQYVTKNMSKEQKASKEVVYQQIELLLQLSDEPEIVRTKPICKKIGEGRVEVGIAKCKHILNRMRKMDEKALLNFQFERASMVLYFEAQNQSKNIKNYDVILKKVRSIIDQKLFHELFGEKLNKWTKKQLLERNELAILLIKDPSLLKSNAKYLEMVLKTENGKSAEIITEVEKCLLNCEYVKEKPDDSRKATVCAPIIAKIKDVKYMSPINERKLTQRIHRLIEQFIVGSKPEVWDVRFDDTDGTVGVVCANVMTFNWLTKQVQELDGLWPNAKISISKAPVTRKVLDIDDLKQIKMTFKTVPTVSFEVMMKQLKKSNSKLNTDRWQSVPSNFSNSKKVMVMVDLESLVELERSKRQINVDSGTIYFDIRYLGTENFDAQC